MSEEQGPEKRQRLALSAHYDSGWSQDQNPRTSELICYDSISLSSDLELLPGIPNPSTSFKSSVPRGASPLLIAMVVRGWVLTQFFPI